MILPPNSFVCSPVSLISPRDQHLISPQIIEEQAVWMLAHPEGTAEHLAEHLTLTHASFA